jgi:hypothetical protein
MAIDPLTASATHEIIDASRAQHYHLLRDAYIDLHGVECTLYSAHSEDTARKDFYGDVRSRMLREEQVDKIRVLIPLSGEDLLLLSTFPTNNTMDHSKNLTGHVKASSTIQAGDRLGFKFSHFVPGSDDVKFLEVASVNVANSLYPLHKTVQLMPVRDSGQLA